jgi:hypothetical protein
MSARSHAEQRYHASTLLPFLCALPLCSCHALGYVCPHVPCSCAHLTLQVVSSQRALSAQQAALSAHTHAVLEGLAGKVAGN